MKAIEAFRFNIERARKLVGLYQELIDQGTGHDQADDVLRASVVLAVGALDAFVHDRVSEQLVPYIKRSVKSDPDGLGPVERQLKGVEVREILRWLTLSRPFVQVRKVVDERTGAQSFQHPGKIEEAFQLIGKRDIWSQVSEGIEMSSGEVKRELVNAAKRRNQIVHEGDREKSRVRRHQKRRISRDDVEHILDFIENVGEQLVRI